MLNRKIIPQTTISDLRNLHLPQPEFYRLQTGIPLFTIHGGSEALCKIEFVFDAGAAYQSKPLVASFTNTLLKDGTTTRSSLEISETLDYYGAYLEYYTTPDTAVIALYSLNKHLHHTVPVFIDLIFHATFPEQEFRLLLDQQIQQFQINNKKVQYRAAKRFKPLLFGKSHPYGQEVTEESFRIISAEDLRSFYASCYTPDNARVIISGDIDRNSVSLLNRYIPVTFEERPKTKQPEYFTPVSDVHSEIISVEHVVQSAIQVGSLTINRDHQEYAQVEFACTVLGGYFGSRLMKNIREDKGYTYGIGARMVPLKNGAYYTIAAEVAAELTQATLSEIRKEMKRLRTEALSIEELALVKNYLRGTLLRSFDGPMALAERFREMSDAGLDNRYYQKVFETIETISAQEILYTAEKYFHEDRISIVIAGRK